MGENRTYIIAILQEHTQTHHQYHHQCKHWHHQHHDWEGFQLQLKKWVFKEALKDWVESLSLMPPGTEFQRDGATYLKVRWPYHFVLETLGLETSRSWSQSEGERGCRNEGAPSGREEHIHELTDAWQKELMVNAVMNGQPMKLSENRCDVVSFPTYMSSSCCILCCL